MPKDESATVLARNRKARHDYHILETLEAGLVLTGTEVKSAREGKVQLKEGYVHLRDGEAFLVGAHISPYSHGNRQNHDPERERKLLLSRRELDRLAGQVQLQGLTVVPLELLVRRGWIKLVIGLAKGKRQFDKRQAEKRKTEEREMRQALGKRRIPDS